VNNNKSRKSDQTHLKNDNMPIFTILWTKRMEATLKWSRAACFTKDTKLQALTTVLIRSAMFC